jgi:hypothetical protein
MENKITQKFNDSWNLNTEKIKRYQESGHVWLEIDGVVDQFAYEKGKCNGPVCTVCGYSPCWHCEPFPKPCISKTK